MEPLEGRPLVQPLLRARVAKRGEEHCACVNSFGEEWWLFSPRAAGESFRASYVRYSKMHVVS